MFNPNTHFHTLYQLTEGEFTFQGKTPEDVKAWQSAFRPRLRQAIGLDTIAENVPSGYMPLVEQLAVEDMGDHLRESWRIWTEPTLPLPFYLLRPKNVPGPVPLVLTPHGHGQPYIYAGITRTEKEVASIVEGERDIAVQAVRQGYLAIAPTTRAFGETRTVTDQEENKLSSCRHYLVHDLLVGRTPTGDRVWDMMRLLDWALALPEIDPTRVAITGNSTGGTISLFTGACDERITVCVPGSYFCTFRGSIGSVYHCDCNYIPNLLRLGEMYDVAGLIAPRPFLAIAGVEDHIFPIEHVRASYARLREIYAASIDDVDDRCALFVGHAGHRYYKTPAWEFINRHFNRS